MTFSAEQAVILRTLADALEAAATDIRAMLDREGPREPSRTIGPYHDASRAIPGWLDWPGR